jgi:hypothetical protein
MGGEARRWLKKTIEAGRVAIKRCGAVIGDRSYKAKRPAGAGHSFAINAADPLSC